MIKKTLFSVLMVHSVCAMERMSEEEQLRYVMELSKKEAKDLASKELEIPTLPLT